MYIKLNLQPISWKHKPTSEEVRYKIRNDISRHTRTITPLELIDAVENGQTFTEGVMTGTDSSSWVSQQILCADIDNGTKKTVVDECGGSVKVFNPIDNPMTVDEAIEIMQHYNLEPYFIYYSFSNESVYNEFGVNRFRIVCVLDRPITDPDKMISYKKGFAQIFNDVKLGCTDTVTRDLARLYFGSVKGSVIRPIQGSVTNVDVLEYLPKPETNKAVNHKVVKPTTPVKVSDAVLIEKACSTSVRFNRLWNGDTSDYRHNHSDADLALCNSLMWWTNGDVNRVDSLFRMSALMRPKWDEPRRDKQGYNSTYGMNTILTAYDSFGGNGYNPEYYEKSHSKSKSLSWDEIIL